MGRRGTDRWIAVCGGVLVNGLILGALVLIEEPAPLVEEQPTIFVELERPQRRVPRPKPDAAARGSQTVASRASQGQAVSSDSPTPAGDAAPAPVTSRTGVDPQWRVDQKTLDRWKLTEGVPGAGWGRYTRACAGLSSEHMTPDEKERCYNGWKDRPATKRPSPDFVGPIDERHWEVPEPKAPSRFDRDEIRKQRCRDYRRGRTPGFSERNLSSTGSPPPSVREGGCF